MSESSRVTGQVHSVHHVKLVHMAGFKLATLKGGPGQVERAVARQLLKEIHDWKRLCRTSLHFKDSARTEGFMIEDVWCLLRQYTFTTDPEDRGGDMWRVRLDGLVRDCRRARLVMDLSEAYDCVYVTIHTLQG